MKLALQQCMHSSRYLWSSTITRCDLNRLLIPRCINRVRFSASVPSNAWRHNGSFMILHSKSDSLRRFYMFRFTCRFLPRNTIMYSPKWHQKNRFYLSPAKTLHRVHMHRDLPSRCIQEACLQLSWKHLYLLLLFSFYSFFPFFRSSRLTEVRNYVLQDTRGPSSSSHTQQM